MTPPADKTNAHYDALLSSLYLWISGGMEENVRKNSRFFSAHDITPSGNRTAVDLGAGCGYGSLALAGAGFSVTAVDFCEPMLAILRQNAGNLPIITLRADILDFPSWSGHSPRVITCLGDTITHLADMESVSSLLVQCSRELAAGGRLIISFRDYSGEPVGSVTIMPVRRNETRIFICRLLHGTSHVMVTDILYTRKAGSWKRIAGSYMKLIIPPDAFRAVLAGIGFLIESEEMTDGFFSIIARKK